MTDGFFNTERVQQFMLLLHSCIYVIYRKPQIAIEANKPANRMWKRTFGHFTVKGLTYWGQNEMAAIFLPTFSKAFSSMKMFEFRFEFH